MTYCDNCANMNPDGTCQAGEKQYPKTPLQSLLVECEAFVSVWKMCMKKPIEVEYREVRGDTESIVTLESDGNEGILTAHADTDYIMRGIRGEVYPIKKDIFDDTYDVI